MAVVSVPAGRLDCLDGLRAGDRLVVRLDGVRRGPGAPVGRPFALEVPIRSATAAIPDGCERVDLRVGLAGAGDVAATLVRMRGVPLRLRVRASSPALANVVNVATSLGVPVSVDWEDRARENVDDLVEVVRRFFHSATLRVEIEPFAGLVKALAARRPFTLFAWVHPDPGSAVFVMGDGACTDGRLSARARRLFGDSLAGREAFQSSGLGRAITGFSRHLFDSGAPCCTCDLYDVCGGLYRFETMDCGPSLPFLRALRAELVALQRLLPPARRQRRTRSASVFVSNRCMNDCLFCAVADRRSSTPVARETVLAAIDDAARAGVLSLSFSGAGEPTLNPDLLDFVRRARSSGLPEVVVFTNGWGFDPGLFLRLVEAGVTGFLVSVHGLGPVHDRVVRRRGSFAEAGNLLAWLVRQPVAVTVNTCVVRANLDGLAALIDHVAALRTNGRFRHTLSVPEWSGNALRNMDDMASLEELDAALRSIPVHPALSLVNCPACVGPDAIARDDSRWTRLHVGDRWVDVNPKFTHNELPPGCREVSCPRLDRCPGVDRNHLRLRGHAAVDRLRESLIGRPA